jgi:uncharacterized repeat protein (TIGR02543 family)
MKKITFILLSAFVLIVVPSFTCISTLFAQSWTSIDGGGAYGINTSTTVGCQAPKTVVFNGKLYAIWREYGEIHIKRYDGGTTWTGVGVTAGSSLLSTSAYVGAIPKIIVFNGALYAAWENYNSLGQNNGIHVEKYDGTSWTSVNHYDKPYRTDVNINFGESANAYNVSLAVFNNKLYAAWVEARNITAVYQIRVSAYDGTNWAMVDGNAEPGLNYNATLGVDYGYNSNLVVYNNQLYLSWKEVESTGYYYQLRVRRYDGGNTWTFVDGNGATGLNYNTEKGIYNHTTVVYNGMLYILWGESRTDADGRYFLHAKQYNGSTWSTLSVDWNKNITSFVCPSNPNALVYGNSLYISWDEQEVVTKPYRRQIRIAKYDGTTRTFIDGNGDYGINQITSCSAQMPVLSELNGDLYALWNEDIDGTGNTNQIRVKKYPLPAFTSSVNVPANATYKTGDNLTFTVNFNKAVTVSGGTPYIPITLNTGGTVNATYNGGSGTKALTFLYTVVSGNYDNDGITVGSNIVLPAGCTIKDGSSIDASLTLNSVGSTTGVLVDAVGPAVTSVSSTTADGSYKTGAVIALTLNFSEAATVTGIPTLALNSGGTASYSSGSGTTVLTFNYTVANGQNSTDLDYSSTSALSLSGGTVKDGSGNDATLTLPNVGGASSLGGQKNIIIDNTAPTVTLSSTATNPTNSSSIPVTITFSEPVAGFVVSDISVTNGTATGFLIVNSYTYTATITPTNAGTVTVNVAGSVAADAAGNLNLGATSLIRTYDNIVPTVFSVSSSAVDGVYKTGDVITITTTFSEAVIVNGTPTLTLNSGGTALYLSGSGSAILTFSYTVASGNRCADLDYLSISSLSLSGGTIKDGAGNNAILTLPEVGSSNSLSGQKNILIGIMPKVTTQSISGILSTTATGNGNVTDLGYPNPIAYGVCWNTNGTPTISDSKADNGSISATGLFTVSMTGLSSGTTFYVRAFVTNSVGTSYGEEVSFTTNGIITYNLNGGTNHVANTATYTYGVGLALNNPTRTGYTFAGWYDNEIFTGSAITSISNTTKGDIILYARWNLTTDVDIANSEGIVIYPNPAKDVVFIKGAKNLIYIYDINSHLVLIKQTDKDNSISIGSLANGVYLIKVNNKNYKLIKE